MLDATYSEQDGCWNCGKVFTRIEYDEERDYFCCPPGTLRPFCFSTAMDEWPEFETDEQEDTAYNEWDKWAQTHRVHPCGKCQHWTKWVKKEIQNEAVDRP